MAAPTRPNGHPTGLTGRPGVPNGRPSRSTGPTARPGLLAGRRRRAQMAIVVVVVLTLVVVAPAGAGVAAPGVAAPSGAGAVAAAGSGPDRPVAVTTRLLTPVLSIRRLPDWISESVADERLAAGLPAIFARLGRAARDSCLVVSRGTQVVFAEHPTAEVLPASNMKVLTATAVLDKLGAASRLSTGVTASTRPVAGTLHGDLYLVGGGDPLLWTPRYVTEQDPPEPLYTSLPTLAARVRAAGIRRITGSVLGDEALFDRLRDVPSWSPSYEEEGDVGPLSALDVNNGFKLSPPYGPAKPAVTAASVFTGLLRARGVKVTGHPGAGISPSGAVPVTSIASAPLGQVVGAVLRVSDDTGAELLTKQLGRRVVGTGSTAAGVKVIRADLAADGLPVAGLRALDGSGLDRGDRVTCELMDDDLRHVGTSGAVFAGLPIAGRTGTLAGRMLGTPAVGRVHAKTGTLDGVSALSGFVLPPTGARAPTSADPTPIVFSFIANGLASTELGVTVGDDLGAYLAGPFREPRRADALPLTSAHEPNPTSPDGT